MEKKTASQCRRVGSNVIKVEYGISLTILEEENSPITSDGQVKSNVCSYYIVSWFVFWVLIFYHGSWLAKLLLWALFSILVS